MATIQVGVIHLRDGRSYRVKWDEQKGHIYVSWGGWQYIGKAENPKAAFEKAKRFIHEK